jgi:oligopeptide transport system ATP-binding protein
MKTNEKKIIIDVKNLSVQFNTPHGLLKAVNDVSFELKEGETLGILGESGSGKSVTVNAIMGLL